MGEDTKDQAKTPEQPKAKTPVFVIDEKLSKSADAKEIESLEKVFAAAAKKFPTEAVTIMSYKKTAEGVTVVLNAEKKGMRKVVIQS